MSQQGIALSPDGRWLYVADSRAVRRMPFHSGLRRNEGAGEIVIPDVPLTVDHPYRTITFDAAGRLYLSVGAEDNLTPGAGAIIVRYTLPDAIPPRGIAYATGERFAVGLRNGEALAWDHAGRLWAFVNGRDFLHPPGTDATFYRDPNTSISCGEGTAERTAAAPATVTLSIRASCRASPIQRATRPPSPIQDSSHDA